MSSVFTIFVRLQLRFFATLEQIFKFQYKNFLKLFNQGFIIFLNQENSVATKLLRKTFSVQICFPAVSVPNHCLDQVWTKNLLNFVKKSYFQRFESSKKRCYKSKWSKKIRLL